MFLTPTHLGIAMEFAQGGDLFQYLLRQQPHCRLLEVHARWIFQQLMIGLDFCHRKVGVRVLCQGSVHCGSELREGGFSDPTDRQQAVCLSAWEQVAAPMQPETLPPLGLILAQQKTGCGNACRAGRLLPPQGGHWIELCRQHAHGLP